MASTRSIARASRDGDALTRTALDDAAMRAATRAATRGDATRCATRRARDVARRRRATARRALETGREETRAADSKRARDALFAANDGARDGDDGDDRVATRDDVVGGVAMVSFATRARRTFEVEYGARRGTTENAYATRGEKDACLIDCVDGRHAEGYAREIEGLGAWARDAAYHAVLHVSPRRLDALAAAIANRSEGAACVEVLCSNPGAQLIQQALKPNSPLTNEALCAAWKGTDGKLRARLRVVRNGERLDLGGRTLRFTLAPTPRWPDLIFARDEKSQTLFTSKFFSAHVGTMEGYGDEGGLETFGEDWRFYFDCLLAPMARQVSPLLEKLTVKEENAYDERMGRRMEEWEKSGALKKVLLRAMGKSMAGKTSSQAFEGVAKTICPAHGPVVASSVTELYREYVEWCKMQTSAGDNLSVAIIYASAYGNTGAMAQAIARGVAKTGVGAEMFNCELASPIEVEEVLKRSAGFALGAPTLGGTLPTPVQTALGAIVKEGDLEKPCGSFGSFGWSGEAVEMIDKRLTDAGFKSAFEPLRCKFKPTAETLQLCEESGTDLAQAVRKIERRKQVLERKSVGQAADGVSDTAAAVGRIVGSLCAVTTKNEDTQSAMLASWVSQASFNPPALTVAVAKERAVESFLMTGGKFNLNVLKSGGEKDAMKALLKPFAPGENRFGALDVDISETNGCAVVKQALACVECTVTKRMEAGDHWVVLAEVERGTLLDAEGVTSIHHRKTGSSY